MGERKNWVFFLGTDFIDSKRPLQIILYGVDWEQKAYKSVNTGQNHVQLSETLYKAGNTTHTSVQQIAFYLTGGHYFLG